jgi:hypothetical protein
MRQALEGARVADAGGREPPLDVPGPSDETTKLPSACPRSTLTELLCWLVTTRSGRTPPFSSPGAMEYSKTSVAADGTKLPRVGATAHAAGPPPSVAAPWSMPAAASMRMVLPSGPTCSLLSAVSGPALSRLGGVSGPASAVPASGPTSFDKGASLANRSRAQSTSPASLGNGLARANTSRADSTAPASFREGPANTSRGGSPSEAVVPESSPATPSVARPQAVRAIAPASTITSCRLSSCPHGRLEARAARYAAGAQPREVHGRARRGIEPRPHHVAVRVRAERIVAPAPLRLGRDVERPLEELPGRV